MRNKNLLLGFLLIGILFVQTSYAQLSGTKTIPGDYASIAAAITALNSQGVGSGGVTFNVAAGWTETNSNMIITATGTSANPIVFQKSGSGANPLITAGAGVGTMDGIIILSGTDYITFDGINLLDPTTNTTTTTQMEWGYALLKVDGTNGSQNVTIRNCSITLQKINTSSYGIYSANHTTTSTTGLTVTAFSGTNSNNKFYSNSIQNCYSGIYVVGFADGTSPYAFYDHFNEIGTLGGNIIRLFGGSSTATYGLYTSYQDSLKVSNNDIAGGTGSTGITYGIYIYYGMNSSATVYNNTIQDTTASTTSATYGLYMYYTGNSGTNNTVIVKRNTVQGFATTAITSGAFYGYYIYYTSAYNLQIDSNKLVNNKWGGPTQTATGAIYGMYIYPYTTAPPAGSVTYFTNNYMGGNRRIQSAQSTGTLYGMYLYYGGQTVHSYNNVIENDTLCSTTSASYYMYVYNYYATTANWYNNTIRNLYKQSGATGAIYAYYISNAAYSGTFNYYNNTVNNITSYASSTIYGIYNAASSVTKNFYGNTAYNIRSAGTGSVYGVYTGSGTTVNIYKNNIYGIRSGSGVAYGLYIGSGTTVNVYNNYISDIRADSANTYPTAVAGIYISSGTNINAYYNTVYLNAATSVSGAFFGTVAIYVSTTPTVDLRNNIFINKSTPGAAGSYTVAHYRSSTTLTTYANTANNNNFYAGTPDASRLLYSDGTTMLQTLADYKTFMAPRESNSVTENTTFVNTTTTPYDLHVNAAVATQCESTGQIISTPISITDDYDAQARYPNTGYPINPTYPPTAPDIGADEFGGIPLDIAGPTISYTPLPNTPQTTARTLIATITDPSGVPTSGIGLPVLYWKINAGSYTGAQATSLGNNQYSFTFGSGVVTGDVVSYYICAQDLVTPPNVSCFPSAGASGFSYNPPAVSTPPTNPSTYTISNTPLSGDYTVGIAMFNALTGKNITFEKVVKKVMKEVMVEIPQEKIQRKKGDPEKSDNSTLPIPNSRKELKEVEEISWIPKENGRTYDGPLYVKKSENPQYSYPDNTEGVYATITAALNDLNLRGVGGPVRFLLTDASYTTETFPLNININNVNLPTATNTFTLKPNTGVTATISGAAPSSQIFMIRNNYVTIDGSNTVSGTTRNLSITNTSATSPRVIVVGSTGTTPITNVTVKNCIITNGVNSSSSMVISDAAAPGTAGWFNNITVQNNSFGLSYIALYSIANVASGNGRGLLITGNNIDNIASQFRLVGVYVQGVDSAIVSNNFIGNDSNITDASNQTGIWFATGTVNSIISGNYIYNLGGAAGGPRAIAISTAVASSNINITQNTITNIYTSTSYTAYGIYIFSTTGYVRVQRNKISNIKNSNTSGYNAIGISLSSTLIPANIGVINNFIWDIAGYGWGSLTTDNGYGINITSGGGYNLYYNSINLATNQTSTSGYPACLIISSSVSTPATLDIRDNIFAIPATVGTGRYCVICNASNTVFASINYNDYYSSGAIGYIGSLERTDLAAWRLGTGRDTNSVQGDPKYVSNTDLHIDSLQISPVNNAGTPISGITIDIDGNTRNATTPDIGADEYNWIPPLPTAPTLVSPANGSTGNQLSLNLVWNKPQYATKYHVQLATDSNFTNLVVNDSTVTDSLKTVSGLQSLTWYYWKVRAGNIAGWSSFSAFWRFQTASLGPAIVNFTVIPGGFYNTSTGRLNMRDTIKAYLIDSVTCQKIDSAKGYLDSVTFSANISFANAQTGSYYLYVTHRNHLTISSRFKYGVIKGSTVSYNFTTDSAAAFGFNMVKVSTSPARWGMIPGDANQDGYVDATDQYIWIQQNGLDGYLSADFNGDWYVDAIDQYIWIVFNGLSTALPCYYAILPNYQERPNKININQTTPRIIIIPGDQNDNKIKDKNN